MIDGHCPSIRKVLKKTKHFHRRRAYFPGSQRRIKPGPLGRRKLVGCPHLFRSSWPDRAQPHAIAPEPTSPTRTRSDVVDWWEECFGGKWCEAQETVEKESDVARRSPKVSRRRSFSFVFTSKFPHSGDFSPQFPPEGSFKFHARVFMLVLTAEPRFSF